MNEITITLKESELASVSGKYLCKIETSNLDVNGINKLNQILIDLKESLSGQL